MNTNRIAIVVVAYNRVDSFTRLLKSLQKVDFEGQQVPLIISIDYSGENKVFEAADQFVWNFGEKRIIRHETNLGLKKHILSCGDLLEDYDAIIVLEDDLMVSPAMYSYAWQAVERYQNDDRIAAISLYAKQWSEPAWMPFAPAHSGSDVYFIQTAESWGQIWMRNQWNDFKEWYAKNNQSFYDDDRIPAEVCRWDDRSWKKYHIKYCIEKNKYTVYPYEGLTTCMGAMGEHTKRNTSIVQVPILERKRENFIFADLDDETTVKYDAFMERVLDNDPETCMDLYGQKRNYDGFRYVISSKILDYRVVDSFDLALRPHEENILHAIKGSFFYQYDLHFPEQNPKKKSSGENDFEFEYYHYSTFSAATDQMLIKTLLKAIFRRLKKKFKKLFRRK